MMLTSIDRTAGPCVGAVLGVLISALLLAAPRAEAVQQGAQVAVAGETLEEALPRLGRAYRTPMRAGKNSHARRIYLFTAGHPLSEVKRELARIVPHPPGTGLWFKSGSFTVFDEDIASLQARERDVRAKGEKEAKIRAADLKRMKAHWDRESKAGGVAGNLATKEKRFHDLFGALPPSVRDAALRGRISYVPFGQLSAEARRAAAVGIGSRGGGVEGGEHFDPRRDLSKIWVRVGPSTSERPGIEMRVYMTSRTYALAFNLCSMPRNDKETGLSWSHEVREHLQRRRGPADADRIAELQKKILIVGSHEYDLTLEEALERLSERADLPLIGEYDPGCKSAPIVPLSQWSAANRMPRLLLPVAAVGKLKVSSPVHEVLEALCRQYDLDWSFERGWIRIKSPRTLAAIRGEIDLSPPRENETPKHWLKRSAGRD